MAAKRRKKKSDQPPWRVEVEYSTDEFGMEPDTALDKTTRRLSIGSGVMMATGQRDIEWGASSRKDALRLQEKLLDVLAGFRRKDRAFTYDVKVGRAW